MREKATCLAMTGNRLDVSELGPMTPENSAFGGTAFTFSIDLRGSGVTVGISVRDRAQTIRATSAPNSTPRDSGARDKSSRCAAALAAIWNVEVKPKAAIDLTVLAKSTRRGNLRNRQHSRLRNHHMMHDRRDMSERPGARFRNEQSSA